MEAAERELGTLDAVVLNAGIDPGQVTIAETDPETAKEYGRVLEAAWPRLKEFFGDEPELHALVAFEHHSDGGEERIKLNQSLNAEQVEWFKAGSALNVLRTK